MGIKSNFNLFLKSTCPEVFETINISEFSFKKIAIDTSLYLHKFKAIYGDKWLYFLINFIVTLRSNEIHCVFIFDGKSPVEKINEQQQRKTNRDKQELKLFELENEVNIYYTTGEIGKEILKIHNKLSQTTEECNKRLLSKKRKFNIKIVENYIAKKKKQSFRIEKQDYSIIKEILTTLNIPFFVAPWEAEKMCAKLCRDNLIDAVLSEDTDVLAYGCPIFLSKINTREGTCVKINYQKLIDCLNLNKQEFLDFCILCGTDYNKNIPRVGSKTAYRHIVNNRSIENIQQNTKLDTSCLNKDVVRRLFTKFENYKIKSISFCGIPDIQLFNTTMLKYNIVNNKHFLKKLSTNELLVIEDD